MSITDYLEQQRTKSFDAAHDNDLDVIRPTDAQIQLDLDRPWPSTEPCIDDFGRIMGPLLDGYSATAGRLVRSLCEYFTILSAEAWRSHGGNIHVQLTMSQELDPRSRIAIQACLGSDPIRELLSLIRVENGCADPIALFKPRLNTLPPTAGA